IMAIDVNDGQIGFRIRADDFGRIFGVVVVEFHGDLCGFLDHVIVGDDVPVAVNYDAGTEGLFRHGFAATAEWVDLNATAIAAAKPEEATEEIVGAVAAVIAVIGIGGLHALAARSA